jgi:hypothetical protein
MPDEHSAVEESKQQWAKQMQDVLADNSKIRENLTDDLAIPFVEWGANIAEHVATRFAAPETPDPDEQQVSDTGYNLARLMTRINWLVTYRSKKDAAWLTRTFAMVNKLSQDVYGEDAPALSDEEIAAWVTDQANHSDDVLIRDLMARYTPTSVRDTLETGAVSDTPEPLSNVVFGKPENLSDTVFGSPPTPGEEEHGEEE